MNLPNQQQPADDCFASPGQSTDQLECCPAALLQLPLAAAQVLLLLLLAVVPMLLLLLLLAVVPVLLLRLAGEAMGQALQIPQ